MILVIGDTEYKDIIYEKQSRSFLVGDKNKDINTGTGPSENILSAVKIYVCVAV